MSLVVDKGSDTEFERAPEGVFVARHYSLVDIGTQQINFPGEMNLVKQVVIAWSFWMKKSR